VKEFVKETFRQNASGLLTTRFQTVARYRLSFTCWRFPKQLVFQIVYLDCFQTANILKEKLFMYDIN